MDVPKYSNADLIKLQKDGSKNFLAKSETTWPKFNVEYFFAAEPNQKSESEELMIATQKNQDAIGQLKKQSHSDDEFVLNIVPPSTIFICIVLFS
jgi:hypothetical protein